MILTNEYVRTEDGQRELPDGPDGGERLPHGAEHPHDRPDRSVPLVHHARAEARRELGPHQHGAVVRDVLDDPQPFDGANLRWLSVSGYTI